MVFFLRFLGYSDQFTVGTVKGGRLAISVVFKMSPEITETKTAIRDTHATTLAAYRLWHATNSHRNPSVVASAGPADGGNTTEVENTSLSGAVHTFREIDVEPLSQENLDRNVPQLVQRVRLLDVVVLDVLTKLGLMDRGRERQTHAFRVSAKCGFVWFRAHRLTLQHVTSNLTPCRHIKPAKIVTPPGQM